MTARVLVVDDVPANVKLLEARLSAEYFDVVTALSGQQALAMCERAECDIVLLDVMMPDMDGFEVCRRIKANPSTHHLPVVMVTALDQISDRVKGLEAGADDFLTKPVSDIALVARVRSLVRLKMMSDELRMRAVTSREIGIQSPAREAIADAGRNGRVLVVEDREASHVRLHAMLTTAVMTTTTVTAYANGRTWSTAKATGTAVHAKDGATSVSVTQSTTTTAIHTEDHAARSATRWRVR